ncbi:MAG: bifunctional phosphopantothenoylcysteine decarboxylase/phosphopantothenate--cysteine ligase CoaBC, partial [Flavisolibacter sp.]
YLSAVCPVMFAPAMDEDMWHHPNTRRNLVVLQQNGNLPLEVGHGELASGLIGEGRMAEPEEIVLSVEQYFRNAGQLNGKKVLVTAGPTYEPIDPVRFIGNHSSGKMGYAIAEELASRGAQVTLVSGPVSLRLKNQKVNLIQVKSADEMYSTCLKEINSYNIAVMAAAVADYTPADVANQKIKKKEGELTISLKRTKDILGTFGKTKSVEQTLVGFALETEDEAVSARKKLQEKNADLIILNSLQDQGAGFGHDTNKVRLFFKNGNERPIELKSKTALAKDIVDAIIEIS